MKEEWIVEFSNAQQRSACHGTVKQKLTRCPNCRFAESSFIKTGDDNFCTLQRVFRSDEYFCADGKPKE